MAIPMDTILGPWGFSGGKFWSFRPMDKIKRIVINYRFNSTSPIAIKFATSSKDDDGKDKITIGGNGPDPITSTETLNIGDDEYLIGISGRLGIVADSNVVTSIKFITNLKEYGPYGPDVGQAFSSEIEDGYEIVGFLGRCGDDVDAIGVYIAPK